MNNERYYSEYKFKQELRISKIIISTIVIIILSLLTYLYLENENNIYKLQENIISERSITSAPISYVVSNDECTYEDQTNTVILRLDDIGAFQYEKTSKKMIEDLLDRNISITLGLIPYNIDEDSNLRMWLKSIKSDPSIEIAIHGFNHEKNEFKYLTGEEASKKIIEGIKLISDNINVNPITFIPPYNEYSYETYNILTDSGIKILSAKQNEFDTSSELISLGYDSRSFDFTDNSITRIDKIILECKTDIDSKGLCVILLHPQDYTIEGTDKLNTKEYSNYLYMLDKLEELNVDFKTFKDLLVCDA